MKWSRLLVAVGSVLLMLAVYAPDAQAAADQAPTSPVGITLSPTLVELDLSKAGVQPEFELTVRNNLPIAQSFDTSSLNIGGLNTDSSVAFLNPGEKAPRGLATNLRYNPANLALQPGESKKIIVSITDVDKLAPGGHYGAAVVGSQTTPTSGSNQVAIRQAVTSLIFLTTKTGGIREVTASAIALPGFGWRLPPAVDVIIENTGNTQTAPVGYARLSRNGTVTGQGILNPDRNLILPDQNRIYKITLSQNPGWRLAGKYTLDVHYQATPASPEQVASRTLWYVNPWFLVVLVAFWITMIILFIAGRRLLVKGRQK